jgi:hypothetical protein
MVSIPTPRATLQSHPPFDPEHQHTLRQIQEERTLDAVRESEQLPTPIKPTLIVIRPLLPIHHGPFPST